MTSSRWASKEALAFLVCAAIVVWQVLLPGFVGLADNRDFAKVAGRLCLGRTDVPASYYEHFYASYQRAPDYCWDSGISTSQLFVARAASWIQQRFRDADTFDIRWLGGTRALLFLFGWALFLASIRPLKGLTWWIAVTLALFVFTDVSFMAYLNTFYTDATAILGAMVLFPAALYLATTEVTSFRWLAAFALGSLLFVTSKGQHAALIPLLIAFLLLTAFSERPRARAFWPRILVAILLLAGAWWVFAGTPYWYKAQGRFNVVFAKLLPVSPTPEADIAELGLAPTDLALIGQHAFLPSSPAFDAVWLEEFSRRGSYAQVAAYWLRHPARTLSILYSDLANEAVRRRPAGFSDMQVAANQPAGAQTGRFAAWSAIRTLAWRVWPAHIIVWYAAVLLIGPIAAVPSGRGFPRAAANTAIVAACAGLCEFGIAVLADGRETDRHLILFHLLTDWSFVLALAWALSRWHWASARLGAVRTHHEFGNDGD